MLSSPVDSATKLAITTALRGLRDNLTFLGSKRQRDDRPYDFVGVAQKSCIRLGQLARATDQPLSDDCLRQFGWTDKSELREQIVFCVALAFEADGEYDQSIDVCRLFRINPDIAKQEIGNWRHAVANQKKADNGEIAPIDVSESCIVSSDRDSDW